MIQIRQILAAMDYVAAIVTTGYRVNCEQIVSDISEIVCSNPLLVRGVIQEYCAGHLFLMIKVGRNGGILPALSVNETLPIADINYEKLSMVARAAVASNNA